MVSHKGSVGLLRLKQNSTLCCFRFGLPFVLYMERTVTWDTLQKEILEKMRHLLRPGVYIQVGKMTFIEADSRIHKNIRISNMSLKKE